MADQSKWSSSRGAHLRTPQQQQPSRSAQAQVSGTQQSRWATTSSATSTSCSHSSGSSGSSSWRARSNDVPASSSSGSRSAAPSSNAAAGSAGSRWARAPARSAPSRDHSVADLTDTLSKASLTSNPPSISEQPARTPNLAPTITVPTRNDTLQPRSTTRPLGGKSLDRLALLASPSRGLDSTATLSTDLSSQGSMDLTLPSVQEELREYISVRLTKAIPLLSGTPALRVLGSNHYLPHEGAERVGKGEEELQQILLLVRKLREALVASRRVDGFALEVYELSSHLAVLCGDVTQLAATLPRLVLELYPATSADSDSGDVSKLATHLGMHHPTEGKRLRLVSLHLLQTLCLSGRATRLGQYSAAGTDLRRGLSEYRTLKATLSTTYGDALAPHLATCDVVYTALRDVDPFALSQLLTGGAVDGWQRLILLSVVPAVRDAAWGIARKAYMYLPVSSHLVGLIQGDSPQPQEAETQGERYLAQLLLFSTDVLPATTASTNGGTTKQAPPDEWDADDDCTSQQREQELRLHTFLTLQFPSLSQRITPIKGGQAVKLR